MKYLRAILLIALLLLAGCQNVTPELEYAGAGKTDSDVSGVEIRISDLSDGDLEVTWINKTEYPVIYGESYEIQRLENGEWVSCMKELDEHWTFIDIGYELKPEAEQVKTYHVSSTYDISKPCTYRFQADCYVENDPARNEKCTVWAEFEITAKEPVIFKEPLTLELVYEGGRATANSGTYCWNYDTGDGTWSGICADALHPLDCKEYMKPVSVPDDNIEFVFGDQPDSFYVRCWPDSQWGNYQADSEPVTTRGNAVELKDGGYIYEVVAVWNNDGAPYHGTVHYYFYAGVTENYIEPIERQ